MVGITQPVAVLGLIRGGVKGAQAPSFVQHPLTFAATYKKIARSRNIRHQRYRLHSNLTILFRLLGDFVPRVVRRQEHCY